MLVSGSPRPQNAHGNPEHNDAAVRHHLGTGLYIPQNHDRPAEGQPLAIFQRLRDQGS